MKNGLNPWDGKGKPSTVNKMVSNSGAAAAAAATALPTLTHRKTGAPAQDVKRFGGDGPMFSNSGEMNAYDRADAHNQGAHFRQLQSSGEIARDWLSHSAAIPNFPIDLSTKQSRQEALAMAAADQTGQTWRSISAAIQMLVSEQQKREGFVRRLMSYVPLNTGDIPRMGMVRRDVTAVVSSGISSVEFQELRNREAMPKEEVFITNVHVQNLLMQQTSGDLLEEGYNQSVEAIMVKEDRTWKALADAASRISNTQAILSGTWDPKMLAAMRQLLLDAGYGSGTMVVGSRVSNAMLGTNAFFDMYDPVTKYELINGGLMGSILGMPIITDSSRLKNLKVLQPGDVYVTAPPSIHGGYTDRGGVTATPVDGAQLGSDSKGWFVRESFSAAILDPITVVKGDVRG